MKIGKDEKIKIQWKQVELKQINTKAYIGKVISNKT